MIGYYYLSSFRWLAVFTYFISIAIYIFRLKKPERYSLTIVTVLLILMLQFILGLFVFNNIVSHLFSFRLYYGFIILFIGLALIDKFQLENIFKILAIITILEKILLIIYPGLIFILPNYDSGVTFSYDNAASIFGGVHSFGGNRTVTAVILLSGFAFTIKKSMPWLIKAIILFASILCFSGTAIMLTIVYAGIIGFQYIISKSGFIKKYLAIILFIILALSLFNLFFRDLSEYPLLDRFSSSYLIFILNYKMIQINELFYNFNYFNFLFGFGDLFLISESNEIEGYGSRFGDFLMLDFFGRYGSIGLITFITMFLLLIRKSSAVPFFIMVFGSFHYHVLFSGPGQIIAALILANGLRDNLLIKDQKYE